MQKTLSLILQNMSEKNATLLTHSLNVAKLCMVIARNMGMDTVIEAIALAVAQTELIPEKKS